MKSHISATNDHQLVEELARCRQEERRSRSQIIEMAREEFLSKRGVLKKEIVTFPGRLDGRFSRKQTYVH